MEIEEYLKEECIIITPRTQKKELLKLANQKQQIIRAKIWEIETLASKFFYKYHDLTLYALYKEFHISYSLGTKLLPYFYHIEEKDYTNEKINQMVQLKKHLENKNYLIKDTFLSKFIENKKLVFYNCTYVEDTERKILEEWKKRYQTIEIEIPLLERSHIKITETATMEEEVVMVAEKIATLLDEGLPISMIKIHLGAEDYTSYLHRIFPQFGIPYILSSQNVLMDYDMSRYFLTLLGTEETLENIVAILRETYDLDNNVQSEVYQTIISLLNQYLEITDRHDLILLLQYQMKHTKINNPPYENAVEQIDIMKENAKDCHVFLLGFMTNVFPKQYKDDMYLSDKEASLLNISSSLIKNERQKESVYNRICQFPKLAISYCLSSHKNAYTISSYVEYLKEKMYVQVVSYQYQYTSLRYNVYLLCKHLDSYTKYGQKSEELWLLYGQTPCLYKQYQHDYTPVHKETLYAYLNQSLTLSYSSIDTFYQCPFRYYLQYILKIKEEMEETPSIRFGNLVHKILCRVFKEKINFQTIVDEELTLFIEKGTHTMRDLFYLQKYKKEVLRLIEILYKQKERTEFKETYLEQHFSVSYEGNLHITLTGYIDKVLTFEDGENTYVIIIDYKTGVIDTNFNPVVYGMHMQLLIYLYLLKENISNVRFAGTYWQNVMKEVLPYTEGKTYETVLEDAYRLDGYTSADIKVVNKIDKQIENSYVKGLKLKKDETFYAYSKVLSEEEIEKLLILTKNNIDKAIQKIEEGYFAIAPKKIGFGNANIACTYCPYRDICFRNESDIITLAEYKNLEFIGDQNGKD